MTDPKPRTLLHAFSTFRVGGPQIRFCTLANRFGARYRHVIFAMDDCYDCRDRLAGGLNVEIANVLAKKPDTLGNRRRFRSYLKAHRPDLLVTYNWGSLEWAMANWPPLLRACPYRRWLRPRRSGPAIAPTRADPSTGAFEKPSHRTIADTGKNCAQRLVARPAPRAIYSEWHRLRAIFRSN